MSWPNAILTDSGGFQVFSLSGLRKIDRGGRGLSVAPGRRPAHVHAGIHRGRATRLRQRHHDGARRVSRVSRQPRVCAPEHAAHGALGAARRTGISGVASPTAPPGTRCFPSCRAPCSPTCAANAPPSWLDLDADGYAIGGLSVGEPRPLSLEMVEATEDILPRVQAPLRHGRRDARRAARICGPRHRHDGLRAALAQRAQWISVHLRGPRDHQARPLQGRPAPARPEVPVLYLSATTPGPIFAICSSPGRSCTRHWRPGTTSSGTLTSCVRLGTL